MASFALSAHICGQELAVTAYNDGSGWVVQSPGGGARSVGRFDAAVRIASDELGRYLRRAQRKQPWGLVVRVGGSSALYGTPNPAAGVVLSGRPGDPKSLVARIRHRWHEGDGPISALENAFQIVSELLKRSSRAAA